MLCTYTRSFARPNGAKIVRNSYIGKRNAVLTNHLKLTGIFLQIPNWRGADQLAICKAWRS